MLRISSIAIEKTGSRENTKSFWKILGLVEAVWKILGLVEAVQICTWLCCHVNKFDLMGYSGKQAVRLLILTQQAHVHYCVSPVALLSCFPYVQGYDLRGRHVHGWGHA